LDTVAPGFEHADGGLRRLVDQRPRLLLAAPAEAVGRRTALLVAVLDEARADLRGDEAFPVEDPDRVAAEADEQRGDDVVVGNRLEQRPEAHRLRTAPCARARTAVARRSP